MCSWFGWWLVTLWGAWCAQAALSVTMSRKIALAATAVFHKSQRPLFAPPAVVVVPCKGVELGLEEHVRRLCVQDYEDYTLLFVVESEQDAAVPLLRRVLAACPQRRAQIVVAGVSGRDEGQKVHNLRAAIGRIEADLSEAAVWVFADSDAAPGPQWLLQLVAPLGPSQKYALSTGYRWLVPEPGGGGFWGAVASVINASAATFGGTSRFRYAWGGSMAMRAEVARAGDLDGHLRGSLSDDYQATRMVHAIGSQVAYVPRCLVASRVRFDRRSLVEFARRQLLITKVYARRIFLFALACHLLYVAGWSLALAALLDAALAAVTGATPSSLGAAWPLAAVAWTFVLGCDQGRAWYRGRLVRALFDPATAGRLQLALRLDRWAMPLCMAVSFGLLLSAVFGRTICWRGIRYRMDGPQRVRRLDGGRGG